MEIHSFQEYIVLKNLCGKILEDPNDIKLLGNLKETIHGAEKTFIKAAEKPLIACFYPYMKNISTKKTSFNNQEKQLLVDTLEELLNKITIANVTIFFNFYSFLLFEIYDYNCHKVVPATEEYKLAILKCVTSLMKCVSAESIEELYIKDNVPKFSQIIYVCGEILKQEKSRDLKSAAITCILSLAKISDTDDFSDVVIRDKVAEIYMFFLPGLSNTFTEVVAEDLKIGHKILMEAVTAYGRIVALVMRDYNPTDQIVIIKEIVAQKQNYFVKKTKWKDKKEIDEYLDSTKRNTHWYKATDEKLNISFKKFAHLTHHSHIKVRFALVNMASDIILDCLTTMPQTASTLVEFLIILLQDVEPSIATKSREIISQISRKLSSDNLKVIFESLEDGFYNAINSLPRKFNSIDEAEKMSALDLLIGYIKLFGEHKLSHVLLSPTVLQKLIQTLLHISQLKKADISILEEYNIKDLDCQMDLRTPWINFHHFQDDGIKLKIEALCSELARSDAFEIVYDSLYDTFLYDSDNKKEAVYLMNAHISGISNPDTKQLALILNMYSNNSYNNLQTSLDPKEYNLEEIKNNIIVICLLTEGIGKISLALRENFQKFLLKSLYVVLERAGNGHPLISAAGLLALKNITYSCRYSNITELINLNFDFFSYHVERKLIRLEDKEDVLNVLSVVFKYCDKDVLLPMSNIIEEVLLQTCDRFKKNYATGYLKVFKMFILSVRRWFEIAVINEPIKSRKQKEFEYENFKVSGINYDQNFSDDIMEGKTAEELYKEDMEQKLKEENEIEEKEMGIPKPDLPLHIKLTSSILRRVLHFLPSKNLNRRVLVLEILESGIEILRDWEDELLPIVHQIWSPLVERIKEENPLIIRLSINLLCTLARLSKDFIRTRTTKEVLPKIKEILQKLIKLSYLKDRGSAYRYTQNYKLQQTILRSLGPILANLDVDNEVIKDMMNNVFLYLSAKQPKELQATAISFFETMAIYDLEILKGEVTSWTNGTINEEYERNIQRIKNLLDCNTKKDRNVEV